MRFVITQDEATWLRNYYVVKVDESVYTSEEIDLQELQNDAKDKLFAGDYEWLGFDLNDNVESIDTEIVSVEYTDATPLVGRHANEPDPAHVAALVAAAESLLADACDRGECLVSDMSDEDIEANEYPRDEDGDAWYHDYWALNEALKPFLTDGQEGQEGR